MKKINSQIIKDYFKTHEVSLRSSHRKLCIPIINRIYRKMMGGEVFNDIKVCEDLIIDGHHRYVSALLAGVELGIAPSWKTSATKVYDWNDIEFVDEDWDVNSKTRF